MNRDDLLGDQNLTLLEQGKKSIAKDMLDHVASGDKEITGELLSTGELEADVNVPITKGPTWIKGGTLTAFVKDKVQSLKASFVGGFRFTKKF